jgi:hypothetical protein
MDNQLAKLQRNHKEVPVKGNFSITIALLLLIIYHAGSSCLAIADDEADTPLIGQLLFAPHDQSWENVCRRSRPTCTPQAIATRIIKVRELRAVDAIASPPTKAADPKR